ncbi:MAG: ATP-binding cassette domain-containing protein, partial [Chloroflexota bacterium]
TQQAQGKLSRLSRQIMAIEKMGFESAGKLKWSEITREEGGAIISRRPMKVGDAEKRLKALRVPHNRTGTINLRMRSKDRSGNIILRADRVKIGYPDKPLFEIEDMELRRLECAALIGPNGSGKTTFLKNLLGRLEPLAGELDLGASLRIGYFAQAHEDLDLQLTLIEEIDKVGTSMLEKDIRSFLGRFQFSGDDQYKKVSVLSGGERGRLALAKLSLLDANFLLLDEPSNHLDIPAQEILQQVLSEFDGTIIMVSHDRFLIDALATQIWEVDTITQKLKIYEGSYSSYKNIELPAKSRLKAETNGQSEDKDPAKPDKKISKHARQRVQKQITSLEDRIISLETELGNIGEKLQNPPSDADQISKLGEDYAYKEAEVAQAIEEWEALQGKLVVDDKL